MHRADPRGIQTLPLFRLACSPLPLPRSPYRAPPLPCLIDAFLQQQHTPSRCVSIHEFFTNRARRLIVACFVIFQPAQCSSSLSPFSSHAAATTSSVSLPVSSSASSILLSASSTSSLCVLLRRVGVVSFRWSSARKRREKSNSNFKIETVSALSRGKRGDGRDPSLSCSTALTFLPNCR